MRLCNATNRFLLRRSSKFGKIQLRIISCLLIIQKAVKLHLEIVNTYNKQNA